MSDHPQLTAYLLGELSTEESAALEQQLAASPELRQELDALRQTVTALQSAFAQHTETQPAVPAIDREKLHALLRSAVVAGAVTRDVERTPTSVPPGPGGPGYGSTGYGSTGYGSTVAAPALLIRSPRSSRPSTSRGWLLAGTVLVVGGLIGLSQWETEHGEQKIAQVQSGPRDRELLERRGLAVNNGRGGQPLSIEEYQVEQEREVLLARSLATRAKVVAGTTSAPHDPSDAAPISQKESHLAEITGANNQVDNFASSTPHPVRAVVRLSDGSSPAGGSAVVSNGTSLVTDLFAQNAGVMPRYTVPASGAVDYSYYTHQGPANFFGNKGLGFAGRADQSSLGRHYASDFGLSSLSSRLAEPGDTDGDASLYVDLPPVNAFFRTEYAESVDESRVKGRSLQRGAAIDNLSTESLMMTEPEGLSAVDGRGTSSRRKLSRNLWGELPALTDFAEIDDSVHDPSQTLGVTPRIVIQEEEEALLGLPSETPTGGDRLAREKKLRAVRPQLQPSLPPSLTVTDYEEGFIQLGKAVQNWDRFTRGDQSHGTQPAESKEPAPAELHEVSDLETLVADQQTEFKTLREKTPGIEGKPLTEVAPEVAKNAELALLRIRRELAREQAVWYYREGYVRQLEATIAAAEQYAHVPENDFVTPEAQPLSTFGIDVDTASYSNVRRFVEAGQLPPPDAVRIEELINSFQYDGPKVEGDAPLAVAAEVSLCPWQPQHQLLRVALKGKSIDLQQRPPARLVFLVDTSGSMSDENKLPLVKQSLRILVEQMREQDRLSIVTYSDNAGLLLDSTGGDKREVIQAAIESLNADGSTNGEAGLKLAYEVAVKQFGAGATNRVMLCTDGDFNVGESADSELVKLIEKQRQTGVFLNIFGFGSGNLKDAKLEAIADKGNGQYIYIDGLKEARKTLLNELTGTLYTIAKDVKLQIEFNPNLVGSYRLVGYENRVMAAKDFANDKVDSGDMGAGHSVVALYEIVPPGAPQPVAAKENVEPLKYKRAGSVSARSEPPTPAAEPAQPAAPADPLANELCTIRVRYKQPTSNESTKIETVVHGPWHLFGNGKANVLVLARPAPISRDHIWATAVAQFGLLTRHSTFVGTGNYSQVLELAQSAIGDDPTGQRREFVTLVRQTQSLSFERERQLAEISRRAEQHRRVVDEIKTVEQAPDVMTKASCSGKYKTLLRRIEVADDQPLYGDFKDYGRWDGAEYKTHQHLPHGYWVYVAPHWYIWGESTEQTAVVPAK